jgi:hypothetical protein
VCARPEALEGRIDGEKKQKGLTRKKDAKRSPREPGLVTLKNGLPELAASCRQVREKNESRQDESHENEGVKNEDEDAPFAHRPSGV